MANEWFFCDGCDRLRPVEHDQACRSPVRVMLYVGPATVGDTGKSRHSWQMDLCADCYVRFLRDYMFLAAVSDRFEARLAAARPAEAGSDG